MRGTVIKRGISWSVVIDLGRDGDGKRVRKWHSGYATRREAERARVDLLSQVDKRIYVAPNKLTIGQFLVDEWLPAKRATVKATTIASYEMHVRKHIVPRLGGVALVSVGAPHLNGFYAELLATGRRLDSSPLSPTTVRRIHATLHKALADAVRWGRLSRNPADQSDPPRASTPEMSVWSPDQLRTFLESVRGDRLFAAWLTAATTGMRRGELIGLRWSDLDLEGATASVRQIRTIAKQQILTLSPKTDKGTRTISLDQATVAALRSYRVAQMEERMLLGPAYRDAGDIVFTRADGAALHPERFSAWFKQRCRRSGLPNVRLHDVRHSYVTALPVSPLGFR